MSRLAKVFFVAAGLLGVSAAGAAPPEWRTMSIGLPDGSVAEVQYVGDIPPRITVSAPVVQDVPTTEAVGDLGDDVVYGAMPRARRIVQAHPQPGLQQSESPQLIVLGAAPRGSRYQYTLITTGTDGRACTQRTQWLSRGPGKEPEVTRTDTGYGCAAAGGAAPWLEAAPFDPDLF